MTDFSSNAFEQRLADVWDPEAWRDVTVLVAVSGGADSVALLCGLRAISRQQPGQLMGAHYNHQLRGAESDEDERFVRELCDHLDLPCETGRAAHPIESDGDGLEAAARRQRYDFLRQTSDRSGARFVAMAHTADDQAETILHRIVRGTGLAGLAGIPATRALTEMTTIIRPLLSVTRNDNLRYLADRDQPYRIDSSNDHTHFTRNRIRHELLPMLSEEFNPQVVPSLVRLGALAREAQQVVDSFIEPLLDQAVVRDEPQQLVLSCAALADQPAYLVRELFIRVWCRRHWPRQSMSESKWKQLGDLVQGQQADATITLPGAIQAQRRDDVIVLRGS